MDELYVSTSSTKTSAPNSCLLFNSIFMWISVSKTWPALKQIICPTVKSRKISQLGLHGQGCSLQKTTGGNSCINSQRCLRQTCHKKRPTSSSCVRKTANQRPVICQDKQLNSTCAKTQPTGKTTADISTWCAIKTHCATCPLIDMATNGTSTAWTASKQHCMLTSHCTDASIQVFQHVTVHCDRFREREW